MNNLEPQTTLGTRHRTRINNKKHKNKTSKNTHTHTENKKTNITDPTKNKGN